jgi:pheromone shutdown protein TraB
MTIIDNSKSVHHLQIDDKQVILIGTAHVSKESAQQVRQVIQEENPDTVCVELCQSRYQSIRQKERWQETDIVKIIKEKKSFLLLSNLLLASFQKRIAKKLDIKPGQEMITAIETAEEMDAEIHLADRDIRTTLSRTWRAMGLWSKIKLLFQLMLSLGEVEEISEEDIEKMKNEDVLTTLLAEVGKSLPVLKKILIDERDQYLAEKIRTAPGGKIVAVVGAGHVPGIKKYWNTDIDIRALEQLPPKSHTAGVLKWLIPGAIMAMFIAGFFLRGCPGRQRHDYLVDRRQCDFSRHRRNYCAGTSDHHCHIHAGSPVDVIESDDCRRLGVRIGGSLFPQTESKRFRKIAGGYPFGQGILEKQSHPDSAGGRIYQPGQFNRYVCRFSCYRQIIARSFSLRNKFCAGYLAFLLYEGLPLRETILNAECGMRNAEFKC